MADGKCSWYFPPKPLREILTPDERIDELEKVIASFEWVPSRVLAQIRKEFNELKGITLNLQNKLNEHVDRSKKGKKKQPSEGVDLEQRP